MFNIRKLKVGRIQAILSIFLWLLVFAIPMLFGEFDEGINWDHLLKIWKEYFVILGIFFLNHFVLLPYVFFRGKRVLYFVSVAAAIALFVFVLYAFDQPEAGMRIAGPDFQPGPRMEQGPHRGFDGPPPGFEGPPSRLEQGRGPGHRLPPGGRREPFIPPFANLLIFSILIIGFDTGMVFSVKWIQSEQNKLKLEKENVETKMAFLQNQISPHFFMNTLNNIHALIDISSEEAKGAVLKLSKMMAHLLYETQTEKVRFRKEIEFISSYVELMKLRFTEHVKVEFEVSPNLSDINVPPLLSISFIENAFKHGVSYEEASFIKIFIKEHDERIYFRIENSNHAKEAVDANSGIGLENSKKRLELIYGDDYELKVDSKDDVFGVYLNIPI